MSIDRVLRRALNGVRLIKGTLLEDHYYLKLDSQEGPIAAPKWYISELEELNSAFSRVKVAQFEPCSLGFTDARGDALMLYAEVDFLNNRHTLGRVISDHLNALKQAFSDIFEQVPYDGDIVLCHRTDGKLAVAQYIDGYQQDIPAHVVDKEYRLGGKTPIQDMICVLEPDDQFYPEQPVAIYSGDELRGCGFAVEKKDRVRVYVELLSGRVASIPLDSGVDIVPLRAERKIEFDDSDVKGHPYRKIM